MKFKDIKVGKTYKINDCNFIGMVFKIREDDSLIFTEGSILKPWRKANWISHNKIIKLDFEELRLSKLNPHIGYPSYYYRIIHTIPDGMSYEENQYESFGNKIFKYEWSDGYVCRDTFVDIQDGETYEDDI